MRLLILVCSLTSTAWAGPWTRDRGGVYLKVGQSAFAADQFVDSTGATVDAEYLGLTTSLYGEVGVADGVQMIVYAPFIVGRNTNETGDRFASSGGGDLALGVQWSTPWLDFPHALRGEFKLPLYDPTEPGGTLGTFFPDFGDGQLDASLWLSVGGSLDAAPIYGFVELGHRFRTEAFPGEDPGIEYADSGLLAAQLGWTVFAEVILAANVTGVVPWAEDDTTKGYLNAGPSIFAPVGAGFALEASYDRTILATNSSIGQSVALGVSYTR